MPIPASCSCGSRFAANDSLAGKRVACPTCGQAMTIPVLSGPSVNSQMPFPSATGQSHAYGAAYPPYSATPTSSGKPWGLIAGVGGGVVLLVVVLAFVGISAYRSAMKHMPRAPARTSKLPPEFFEQRWKQLNPGPAKWEPYPLSGGYIVEWPSTKAVPFPRNGFDSVTLVNGRALGPDGPYFSVKVSSAGLLSQLHGKPGESSQEVLALAIQRRQSLPGGNLTKSTDFQMDGNPGKEMTFTETIDGKPIVIHVRMLVTKQHIYAVWIGGLETSLKQEDVRRFLDSFQKADKKK